MKKYIKPTIVEVKIENNVILAGSGGLDDGNTPGNGYDPSAPSYGKGGMWSDED